MKNIQFTNNIPLIEIRWSNFQGFQQKPAILFDKLTFCSVKDVQNILCFRGVELINAEIHNEKEILLSINRQ